MLYSTVQYYAAQPQHERATPFPFPLALHAVYAACASPYHDTLIFFSQRWNRNFVCANFKLCKLTVLCTLHQLVNPIWMLFAQLLRGTGRADGVRLRMRD